MALASFVGYGVPYPAWPPESAGAPTLGSYLIDASGEKVALIAMATAAKAIRKVHIRTGTVTTGDTVDVRVETVDSAANGDPTGTLWASAGSANAALAIASGDDTVWKVATLTNDTNALAIGDVFALVVVNGAGGGVITIANAADVVPLFPYGDHFTASWAKGSVALIVPEYSDGTFEPIFGFTDTGGPITATAFNSGSTTNRRGNIFTVPGPCRTRGCWAWVDADGDFTVKLYDGDGTSVLATTPTINNFQRLSTATRIGFYTFAAPATLAAGVSYRLVVVPGTVTNLTTYDFDVPAVGMLDMFAGGQAMHASVYTSSAWVETTTRRGYLGLFLDQASDGVGGGGGLLRHPGLNGGLNG